MTNEFILNIYNKLNEKKVFHKLKKNKKILFLMFKLKKYFPEFKLNSTAIKNIISKSKVKDYLPVNFQQNNISQINLPAKHKQSYSHKELTFTRRLKKIIHSKKSKYKNPIATVLKRHIFKKERVDKLWFVRRNFKRRSYFFRIVRRSIMGMRGKKPHIRLKRISRKTPIFTKKLKSEKKFLERARESLVQTKRFLYRKQFPKIKGRKNRNFNFYYYNNIDKLPIKFHIGRIVITYLHNNTFINIHNSKKMMRVFSAGKLGFKGPKRSTAYSRQVVARKAVKFLLKTKINILDVFLNSNYNRWYYFLLKEFSKPKVKPYYVRYLIISNPRSHGFLRDKKQRRK